MLRPLCALAAVGILSASIGTANAVQVSASGWLELNSVEFYDAAGQPLGDPSFRDANQHLRALTGIQVGAPSVSDGLSSQQVANYTKIPDLPTASDSLDDGTGSAYGRALAVDEGEDGATSRMEAGCELVAYGRGCFGSAGVSTSSQVFLLNLILPGNARIDISAQSLVEFYLRSFCAVTCNRLAVVAELFADFGEGASGSSRNQFFIDSQFLPGPKDGTEFTGSRGQGLFLTVTNPVSTERFGRIRWSVTTRGESAIVPEPGTLVLLLSGLAGLGLTRRRRVL